MLSLGGMDIDLVQSVCVCRYRLYIIENQELFFTSLMECTSKAIRVNKHAEDFGMPFCLEPIDKEVADNMRAKSEFLDR